MIIQYFDQKDWSGEKIEEEIVHGGEGSSVKGSPEQVEPLTLRLK